MFTFASLSFEFGFMKERNEKCLSRLIFHPRTPAFISFGVNFVLLLANRNARCSRDKKNLSNRTTFQVFQSTEDRQALLRSLFAKRSSPVRCSRKYQDSVRVGLCIDMCVCLFRDRGEKQSRSQTVRSILRVYVDKPLSSSR